MRAETAVNVSALNAFLAGVERRALRIAEIVTRDRDEALDLVQDAMISMARHYAARPQAEWPPLFHRILGNRIRDWQRRQAVRRRVLFWRSGDPDDEGEDPIERIADPRQPGGAELLQREQSLRVLETALRELPARQREAFVLRMWEGLSVEDSARAMGCSEGSVKTHLFRALAALRTKLEGVWP